MDIIELVEYDEERRTDMQWFKDVGLDIPLIMKIPDNKLDISNLYDLMKYNIDVSNLTIDQINDYDKVRVMKATDIMPEDCEYHLSPGIRKYQIRNPHLNIRGLKDIIKHRFGKEFDYEDYRILSDHYGSIVGILIDQGVLPYLKEYEESDFELYNIDSFDIAELKYQIKTKNRLIVELAILEEDEIVSKITQQLDRIYSKPFDKMFRELIDFDFVEEYIETGTIRIMLDERYPIHERNSILECYTGSGIDYRVFNPQVYQNILDYNFDVETIKEYRRLSNSWRDSRYQVSTQENGRCQYS